MALNDQSRIWATLYVFLNTVFQREFEVDPNV